MIDRDTDRRHVAWAIETTGFDVTDQITVSGFWLPGGHAELVVNTDGDVLDKPTTESYLEDRSRETVSVAVVDDERAVLTTLRQQLFDRFDREYNRLIAFNGDTWKSGFDLPFIRSRCIHHGLEWVFSGLQYCDLWEPVEKRLNTTHITHGTSTAINSLAGAHELLFSGERPACFDDAVHPWYRDDPYDPFDDSSEAVSCWRDGTHLPVLQHNLADVHRTWELGALVRAFVSSRDITNKKR